MNRLEHKSRSKKSNEKRSDKDIITFIEDFCQEYLVKQAPKLPDNFKDIVYKVAPYLNAFGIFVIALRLISPFFLLSFLSFIYPPATIGIPIAMIIFGASIVNLILMFMAAKGLFSRYRGSWKLIFYVILFNILIGFLTFNPFNIFRTIISGLIALYIWFQVRSGYKK